MSVPDTITWLRHAHGVVDLRTGPYRLASDPHGAMNELYASAPPDAASAESETAMIVAREIEFVPSPGTFV